ncbi:PAAR-like domain-containing protein [Nannocystis punicea]|uniref:DUF4150 domain-containing protein n=1 Tax=Nannocystis punicea TaxID=2995304 RepID=A0ABY7GW16_9BACT|nr:PAAR-like domain-containing protein [Nannocystis poenicansa]WAS91105.1 DUF4150 domain-containing protein [Nannocystis poenicansa]
MNVTVNPPKTPVTTGSNGVAAATVPNVCKMPGPPAPFVPTPLPNIGKSGESPSGFSKTVTIAGKKVAIRGSTFKSIGDMASKGTGGGLVSANTHGPTKFVGPGSLDVKFEGKNVHLLSDPMLNNCGPSGSPPNSATLMGLIQASGMLIAVESGDCVICKKRHKDFRETKATKTDAQVLAGKYKQQLAKNAASDTTMLGVVECKCKTRYAEKSSITTTIFTDAAKAAGMKHAQRAMDNKQRKDAISAHMQALGRADEFNRAWQDAAERHKDFQSSRKTDENAPAAYPPGSCAAQKALLLLLDDGAIPNAMTEQYFSSAGTATSSKIAYAYIDKSTGERVKSADFFKHGSSVPPCRTCELLVPFLICDRGQTACEHKT